ncbi:MAG TPA: RNA methyltransferase, partial [Candidatus Limisoma gallistercoris]|nr:RNA methyltransferase [Candidatus Limisoma gallistercoris]
MEVTNGIIKWVHSLAQKKNRDNERCFVAEGTKCVLDTLGAFRLRGLFCTENWLRNHNIEDADVVSSSQIERMSMLKTPTEVIAVYEMPDYDVDLSETVKNLNLALDNVQDPGNLGTIIRI